MADGDLSRRAPRDASAQQIIDALNQVNRNVAAAREGIRRVEQKQVRGGAALSGSGAAASETSVASSAELERRLQLLREGRIQSESTARTEYDHLQTLKLQADEMRRVQTAQQSIVTAPGGYRPGGGRLSYFAEQQAAARAQSLAFQQKLGLAPTPGQPGNLIVVEDELALRRQGLERIRVQEQQIAAQRLAAEKLIAEQRAKETAQQILHGGGGVLYYGQPAGQPGAGFTALSAGRATGPGVPDPNAVAPRYARDTFTSLDASRAASANPERLKQFYAEMQQGSIIQANASQQMRRHGALTTEFLQALARGETTFAEFRYQMGATIGKFAGWTVAATAVYGVIGALGVLTRGAKESSAGVQQLHRFINDVSETKAAQGFRDASREINVSIADVANAQAGFLRVYHTQSGALDAARVSLKLTKLDNLSAADSLRFLTATAQGFNLPATRLAFLGDQLANTFRKLGVPIQESAPALARSAAVVHNAGGQLTELIQLIAVARRETGQTGNTIGTAFARSAANFVTKPKSQAVFTAFGLDPKQATEDYTAFVINAIRRARTLSGPEIQKLAAAIGGPQYGARIFTGLLKGYDLLPKAAQIAGSQASGTLDRELHVKLGQIDEQLSSVGHGLERLGAALAEAGVFAPLGIALHTLTGILNVTNDLVDAFNGLPDPLKRSVALLGEGYVALRLLRRTGLGQGLAERTGIGALGLSPEQQQRNAAITSQRRLSETLSAERERVANQIAQSTTQVYLSEARIAKLSQDRADAMATEGASGLRIQTIEQEIVAEQTRVNQLREQSLLLTEQEAVIRAREAEVNATVVGLQKRRLTVQEAATAQGAPIVIPGAGGVIAPAEGEAAVARQQLSARAASTKAALDSLIVTQGIAARNTIEAAGGSVILSKSYGVVEGAAFKASSITARGVQASERALTGLRSAARDVGAAGAGLLASLGPLDIALIASFGGFEAIHAAQDRERKRIEQFKQIFADPKTAQQAAQIRQEAEHLSRDNRSGFTKYADSFLHTLHGVGIPFSLISDPQPQQEKDQQSAQQRAQQLLNHLVQLNTARSQGRPFSGAYLSEVNKQFNHDIQNFKDYSDLRDAINRRIQEVLQSHEAQANRNDPRLKQTIERYRNYLALRAPESADDPFTQYNNVTRDVLTQIVDRDAARFSTRIDTGGKRIGALRGVIAGYITSVERYGAGNAKDLQAISDAHDKFISTVQQSIDSQLQASLKLARSPAEQQTAYGSAVQRYQDALAQLRRTRAIERDGLSRAQKDLNSYQQDLSDTQNFDGQLRRSAPDANVQSLQDQVKKQREVVKKIRERLGKSSTAVQRAELELEGLLRDEKASAFDARDQARQAQLAYEQSQTQDKSLQDQEAVAEAGKAVQDAIRTFGRHDTRTIEAITKQNQAIQQAVQDSLDKVKATGDLRTSQIQTLGTGGDLARARSDIQTLQDEIRLGKRKGASADTLRQLQTDLNNAQRALAQQLKDNADQLAQARFDLAIAGIIDPARRLVKQLQFDTSRLKGLSGTDQIEQLAKIRQDRSDLQQQQVQDQLDQLGFEHDVQKISDQQYIDALRNIINTRKISRSMKRQLLEQIYQLQHQDSTDIELNVGDIRLPSVYDVRRLAKLGTNQQSVVHQSFSFQIDGSKDPQATASEVATKFEKSANTGIKAAMRAAGMRG